MFWNIGGALGIIFHELNKEKLALSCVWTYCLDCKKYFANELLSYCPECGCGNVEWDAEAKP